MAIAHVIIFLCMVLFVSGASNASAALYSHDDGVRRPRFEVTWGEALLNSSLMLVPLGLLVLYFKNDAILALAYAPAWVKLGSTVCGLLLGISLGATGGGKRVKTSHPGCIRRFLDKPVFGGLPS